MTYVLFLVECWLQDEHWEPVGVWYLEEGEEEGEYRNLKLWFYSQYERMTEHIEGLGTYSQQLMRQVTEAAYNHMVFHLEVNVPSLVNTDWMDRYWEECGMSDPCLLRGYSGKDGYGINRYGPFEIEMGRPDPLKLISAFLNKEAVPLGFLETLEEDFLSNPTKFWDFW